MALVVKRWYASSTPNTHGEYIHVFARRQGLFSWILSLMRLDPTVYFGVFIDQIEFRVSSLSGYVKEVAPISSIASCSYGYSKPWKSALALFLATILVAFEIAKMQETVTALAVLAAGVFITAIYFIFGRFLSFGVTLHSGDKFVLPIKRSVIEDQEIGEKSFEHLSAIISSILRRQQGV